MSDSVVLSYRTSRGTISYSPADFITDKTRKARLPAPPCRPRQRRPHSIHITRLPAGFVPYDLRPQPPKPEPKKPSRFRVELRKLASRESAKRVLGSVFSPQSPNPSTTQPSVPGLRVAVPTIPTAIDSPGTSNTPRSSIRSSLSFTSGDPSTILSRRMASSSAMGDTPRPSLVGSGSPRPSISDSSITTSSKSVVDAQKPLCAGNGVSCRIILAEPVVFLTGLDHDGTTRDSSSNSTGTMLRGRMQVEVTKSAKIKAIVLTFKGRGRTEWPEGIPPAKTSYLEEDSLRTQGFPFYEAKWDKENNIGYGHNCNYVFKGDTSASSSVTNLSGSDYSGQSNFSIPILGGRSSRSSTLLSTKDQKRLSLQNNQSRSFQKGESPFGDKTTPAQKGYKTFPPGIYEYAFEVPIDNNSPETAKLPMASVKWELEAVIQRSGTFKPNLVGSMEIPVVRAPSEDSLELFEPISINRKWEDQLHYEIMISGKSFPIGTKIPIAFKLTPLAKVQVHKLKVYVSENIEYFCSEKKVARRDTTRKILLIEKSAGKPLTEEYAKSEVRVLRGGEPTEHQRNYRRGLARQQRQRIAEATNSQPEPLPEITENMLGDLDLGLEQFLGQTEIEMNVQLPTCEAMQKDVTKRLAPDCTWKNVDVHHWIKIILRLSRLDTDDPTGKKRRHFEISIDSPITLLSCRATQANLALPEYTEPSSMQTQQRVCGCPGAATAEGSPSSSTENVPSLADTRDSVSFGSDGGFAVPDLARPAPAHLSNNAAVQRPIHMLRAPSFNPPAFDADEPPPPLATPPPLYDHVIGTPSVDGLADYFARLGEFEDDRTDTDDEDGTRAYSKGRVNVVNPRTPGGRIARSMDIDRNFMFNADAHRMLTGQASTASASNQPGPSNSSY